MKYQGKTMNDPEWFGMLHCWQIFVSKVIEGQEAINTAGDFIKFSLGINIAQSDIRIV